MKRPKKAGADARKVAAMAARQLGALDFDHDTDKAIAAYREAVDLDPENADGWNHLGHLLRRTGDLDGAEHAYGQVLSLGNIAYDDEGVATATGANFRHMGKAPELVLIGFVWMAVHVVVLLTVAKLVKAPIYLVAVGSQANIGGAASAPVVASAFHPSLAPVGVLLAVAGYVLGTYAGLLCMVLLRLVAGVP